MSSKIEWTDETWNPVSGCTKVSQGCKHCYAERMARRLAGRFGYPVAPHHFDVTLHPDKLELPLRWRKPRTVFVCSMGDLFHEDVPFEFIKRIYGVFDASRRSPKYAPHTYQVLTKRPDRMVEFYEWLNVGQKHIADGILSNVWLGVTVETPEYLWRVEKLMKCPAAVRFVSLEPLLAPMGRPYNSDGLWPYLYGRERFDNQSLSWIIAGGESGPGARPMHPDWARGVRDQCQAAGAMFFFKGWGAFRPAEPGDRSIVLMDRKGHDLSCPDSDWYDVSGHTGMSRVGTKAAGRLLDGREHSEIPERRKQA